MIKAEEKRLWKLRILKNNKKEIEKQTDAGNKRV